MAHFFILRRKIYEKIFVLFIIVTLLFGTLGCTENVTDSTSGKTQKTSATNTAKPQLTAEEVFFAFYEGVYLDGNFQKASEYYYMNIESIFNLLISEIAKKNNVSEERVYVALQREMKNANINDFDSYISGLPEYLDFEDMTDAEVKSKLDSIKQRVEITQKYFYAGSRISRS
ncbi:MAG: hypothetical protein E7384_07145 [Ruminococcaceae bacterium]|nr:hypothetical protein [Oscillospiraceae bacterium]